MIRHVSVLTFADGTTDEQVRAIEEALTALAQQLPRLRAYQFGRDLALADTNASFAVVADFDTVADYAAYRDDPEHRRILAELIGPVLAARAAVQYEIDGAG